MSIADDAVTVCACSANPVTGRHGSASTIGAYDVEDRLTDDASGLTVRERVIMWRVPAHQLPHVTRGSTVVLSLEGAQVSYRVREVELANGGSIAELTLVAM
jgi:hypothetical protein